MYNGQKVYDVHGHVTAPDAYRAGAALLMASNTAQTQSVLMQPNDRRPGPLQDENFKRVVETQHVQYMDERNIDVQIIGPRPFLMMGWMSTGDPAVLDAPDQRRDRQAGLLLPGPLPGFDAAAAERPRAGHEALPGRDRPLQEGMGRDVRVRRP